ncbi:MAG TPA: hypothetical protein VGO43_07280 [Pyrinomonadaceae bacterium]|jgi:hypothetical protein|nr:hypothetical protein [Pyrinomonadaceae bacterium]
MKNTVKRSVVVVGLAVILGSGAVVRAFSDAAAKSGRTPSSVEAEYKRLKALGTRLGKMPVEKLDREPHKSFIRRNKKDIVYSEPAGQWFVRADRYWALAERNKKLPIADDIAWTAAQTPLPGECEGDVNCDVFNTNVTLGAYLRMFPAGKHSKKALSQFIEWMSPMVTGPDARSTYNGPTEAAEKAELAKMISELRRTLAKVTGHGKDEPLSLLDKLADTYVK